MHGYRSVSLILGVLLAGCAVSPPDEGPRFPLPPNRYVKPIENLAEVGEEPLYYVEWWGCWDQTGNAPVLDPYYYDDEGPDRYFTCAGGTGPPMEQDGWVCYVEDTDTQNTIPPTC